MPKAALHTLLWLSEQERYILLEQGHSDQPLAQEDDRLWSAWLAAHSSLSFQGRHGQLNLLKEARARGGEGYWYAYHRQGERMCKKYAGRSSELTIARLESIAQTLSTDTPGENVSGSTGPDAFLSAQTVRAIPPAAGESRLVAPASTQALLLAPKLSLPRLHASLIQRGRLLTRLDAALEHTLTLLAAPAGSGKTTLVRQWIADRSSRDDFPPVAWVALDAGDNDPVRFWRYLFTACQIFRPDPGQAALTSLSTPLPPPFAAPPLETALTTFLNGLAQCERGGILVLEDFHAITGPQLHGMMTFFLDHLPPHLTVMILSRSEPPLPLARLGARGDLYELHAADLRFSAEETAAFLELELAIASSQLPVDALRQLDAHLQGWPAGLRLLALALHGETDEQRIELVLRTFAGVQRSLQAYLVTEVLDLQPEPVQDFLLRTSVLARLNGSLCDAITGRNDSSQLLESLEQAGLFLELLADAGEASAGWYRYHALFAEAMQREADHRMGSHVLHSLSCKASHWFEEHGMLTEAVEAALQAQESLRVAELIAQLIGEQVLDARPPLPIVELHTLRRWLSQLSDDVLKQYPLLCLSYAISLLSLFVMDQRTPLEAERAERLLQMAEQRWQCENNTARLAEVFAFRALITRGRGDPVEAVSWARRALAWLLDEAVMWRSLCLRIIGLSEYISGHLNSALKFYLEGLALSETTGLLSFIRANILLLCDTYLEQGALHLAAESYRRMLIQAREMEDRDDICHALLGLASLSYEWNDLATALRQVQEALSLSQQLIEAVFQVQAIIMQARVMYAQGETSAALEQIAVFLVRFPALPLPASPMRFWLMQDLLTWQCQLQFAQGDLSAVQRWMGSREQDAETLPGLHRERGELLIARWLLAQGKADEALALLTPLPEAAQQGGRVHDALEIRVLIALSYAACKQMTEARKLLLEVLIQTHPEGYVRLFVDEGEAMASLLQMLIPHLYDNALLTYVKGILQAFPQEQRNTSAALSSSLSEPLSAQERRVLRLLMAGRTNSEIADELVISINTVKTHLQRLYRKLGVGSRREALQTARRQRLV